MDVKSQIESGQSVLGIELGSTRIKAVLIDDDFNPVASGGHGWENSQVDGIWTYSLEEIWAGIAAAYAELKENVKNEFGVTLKSFKGIGFSGMMHGYMVFDENDEQLVPFRTWRNNITGDAASILTDVFSYNIPQRWTIAHLYQSVLNGEAHVKEIEQLTTLAGYIHYKLTGEKVMGVGEASGMFPIDLETKSFDKAKMDKFDVLVADKGYGWKIEEIMPKVLVAGEEAGSLTAEGAALLDPAGDLEAGIPLCPPEGDAGTGMVATNSVAVKTGNVSAGTSVFAMLVLEKDLSKVHHEIDLVTTPDGFLVGMAHSNNCTSDTNGWIGIVREAVEALGFEVDNDTLFETMYGSALKGEADCGGLLSYGYISGEHMTGFSEGRPLFVRSEGANFNLANFFRTHMYTALCALKTGLNILIEEEKVEVDEIRGHGGFFKTPVVGQKIMAAATNTPISLLETAGEGGAWGIALLASFMASQKEKSSTLPEFLNVIFKDSMGEAMKPDASEVEGFNSFFEKYHKGLAIEKAAIENV